MTDDETIDWVLTLFEIRHGDWAKVHRNGNVLLALPPGRKGALRALKLYQPQRFKARAAMMATWLGTALGLHQWLLPAYSHQGGIVQLEPDFQRAKPYSTGILLGSPEHRVRRAIASYQTDEGWEVAKIAFGKDGAEVLEQEARVMDELQTHTKGIPRLLGLHRGEGVTLLRMPYLTGIPVAPDRSDEAVRLLIRWGMQKAPKPSTDFSEWPMIEIALKNHGAGSHVLAHLSQECLRPAIRHGDFARWNLLRQNDGTIMAIDWEWGHSQGMPGLDLAHYFLQDHRLVARISDSEAIQAAIHDLNRADCMDYLRNAGWISNPLLLILASLAWKQGAGHQENASILEAAVGMYSKMKR